MDHEAAAIPAAACGWWKCDAVTVDWLERARSALLPAQGLLVKTSVGEQSFETIVDAKEQFFRGVGAKKVWPALARMCLYLDDLAASSGYKGTAVELGAGVGVPGMRLAQHGWSVVLTDLPVLLPLTALNVEANAGLGLAARGARTPTIAPLRWGCTADAAALRTAAGSKPPDLCFGSDITYFDDDFAPLLSTLRQLGARDNVIAIQNRNGCHETFAKAAEDLGWKVEPATCITYMYGQSKVRSYSCNRCTVLRLTRADANADVATASSATKAAAVLPSAAAAVAIAAAPAASAAVDISDAVPALLVRETDVTDGKTRWAFATGAATVVPHPAATPAAATPAAASMEVVAAPSTEHPPYAVADYWEKRYVERPTQDTFEWYAGLAVVEAPLLAALPDHQMRILHVGSGNSKLPEEMWAVGFRNQLCNDISPTCVSRMAKRTATCDGMAWAVEDALSMPQHADGSFDAVVDKGTYDALSCDQKSQGLVSEVRRVLRTGGVYVCISSLESTKLAFAPPRWAQGEWAVTSTNAKGPPLLGNSGPARGNCWVHAAVKVG